MIEIARKKHKYKQKHKKIITTYYIQGIYLFKYVYSICI